MSTNVEAHVVAKKTSLNELLTRYDTLLSSMEVLRNDFTNVKIVIWHSVIGGGQAVDLLMSYRYAEIQW